MKKNKLIVFNLAITVAAISAAVGGYLFSDYLHSAEAMETIQETAYKCAGQEMVVASTTDNKSSAAKTETKTGSAAGKPKVQIPVDIPALKKTNPDILAWISIPGTKIDYPIAQHPTDDGYYLKHGADGLKSSYGSLYMEACEKAPFQEFNTVVYGHNMNDGSMFAGLHLYEDKDFFDKHRELYVYTADHIFTYEVFAAVMYSDIRIPYYYNDLLQSDRTAFLESLSRDIVASRSIFVKGYDVTEKNCIITLSTCDKTLRDNRFLVVAKLKKID